MIDYNLINRRTDRAIVLIDRIKNNLDNHMQTSDSYCLLLSKIINQLTIINSEIQNEKGKHYD